MNFLFLAAVAGFLLNQATRGGRAGAPIDSLLKTGNSAEHVNKTSLELLSFRNYGCEEHYARTIDGYHIHLIRIINPLIDERSLLKRPVVFNHGLLESETIWLINSFGIEPQLDSEMCRDIKFDGEANDTEFNNGPMMLANHGYDVWVMSSRGTDFSRKHDSLSDTDPEFWNYSLDDFALRDIPAVISHIRQSTRSQKVGYVGHSQATLSIFALLATRPEYADIVEPVVALAPVAYMNLMTSAARAVFIAFATFGPDRQQNHEPFPPHAVRLRNLHAKLCVGGGRMARRFCDLQNTLIGGRGETLLPGFFSHIPFTTSSKVMRHFGQIIKNGRYQHYDYGKEGNLIAYQQEEPPKYPIERIRSKSICFFSTRSDALSRPADVERLRKELTVPLFRNVFIDRDFNHFDMILNDKAGRLIFRPMLEIFEFFEHKNGLCADGWNITNGPVENQLK